MDSNEIFKQTQKIKVDTDTTDAILTLIDNKINQDMKEVINEIHKQNGEIHNQNKIFETKFDQVRNEIHNRNQIFETNLDQVNIKFETKFDQVNSKFDQVNSNIKIVFWVISIATAIISLVILYATKK